MSDRTPDWRLDPACSEPGPGDFPDTDDDVLGVCDCCGRVIRDGEACYERRGGITCADCTPIWERP